MAGVDFDSLRARSGLKGTMLQKPKASGVDFGSLVDKTNAKMSESRIKQVYKNPAPSPSLPAQEVSKPATPALTKEDWNRVGGMPKLSPLYAGTGDTIKLMGGALDFASGGKYGGRLKKYGEEIARDFTDEEALSALGEFDAADLKNPSFWYQKGLRTIPNTVALLPAAIIGGYAGGATAGAIGLGAFGRSVLGLIGGAGLSRTVEGAMEASGIYDEAKMSGMDDESARAAASIVFRNNYKLAGLDAAEFASIFLPTKYLPKPLRGGITSAVTKIAANVGMEGAEEVYQNKIGADALGKEFDVTSPENRESFVLGGAMGGLFGSGGIVIEKLHTNFVKNLPKEGKESFEAAKSDLVLKGVDPKEAEIRALDSVIEESSPEMESILKKSVAETVEQVTVEVEKMKQETVGKTVSNKDMSGTVQEDGTVKLDTPLEIGGKIVETVPFNSNWSDRPLEQVAEAEAKMKRDEIVKEDLIKIAESIAEKKASQPKAEKPVVAKPPVAEPVKEEAPVINFDMGLEPKKKDPLLQEAGKYKSAEEFVKAQGESLMHGGEEIKSFSDKGKGGVWLTNDSKMADIHKKWINYASNNEKNGVVTDAVFKPKKTYKIKDGTDSFTGRDNNDLIETPQEFPAKIESLKKQGYDSIRSSDGKQLFVFDASKVKTKSQLTDLYNKAQGGLPKVKKTVVSKKKKPVYIDKNPDRIVSIKEDGAEKKSAVVSESFVDIDGGDIVKKAFDANKKRLAADGFVDPVLGTLKKKTVVSKKVETGMFVQDHIEFKKALREGNQTVEAFKKEFESVVTNAEAIAAELNKKTKDQLKQLIGGIQAYYVDRENKAYAVKAAYSSMLMDFALAKTVTYGMGSDSLVKAIRKMVDATTEADLKDYAERVKQARAEREANMEATKKALSNPETKEEFRTFIEIKGKEALKGELLERYDILVGETAATRIQKEREAKAVVEGKAVNTKAEIVETKHTKTGESLFVVTLADRVEKDVYSSILGSAKRLGGWYSAYRVGGAVPGFQFKTKESAEQFVEVLGGKTVVSESAEERQVERKESQVDRLMASAETIRTRALKSLNQERKTNTQRRAGMANSAEEAARLQLQQAESLENIAGAIERGEAQLLGLLSTRTQIEALDSAIRAARSDYGRKHDIRSEKWDEIDINEAISEITNFPGTVYNTQNFIEAGKKTNGFKRLAAAIERQSKDGNMTPSFVQAEEMAQLAKVAGIATWWVDPFKRIASLGVRNAPEYRAVLREYAKYKGVKQEEDKATALERKLIGAKVGIDFFPTPTSVSERMVAEAGIEKGMRVLEPSAGNGNIAVAIKNAGVDPDVAEISSDLRDILDAKGFNIIGQDFLEVDGTYDRIVMNPPFSNNLDIKHVRKAYDMLVDGGRLVAIVGEGAFFRSGKTETEFRDWLDSLGATVEKLPEGTFTDTALMVTTGTNARLVIIDKQSNASFFMADRSTRGKDGKFNGSKALDNITEEEVYVSMSQPELLSMVKRMQKTINPDIRNILAIKIAENIASGYNDSEYDALGLFNPDIMTLFLKNDLSKKDAEYIFMHEVNHAAFSMLPAHKRQLVIEWYKGLSESEKVNLFFDEKSKEAGGDVYKKYLNESKKRKDPDSFMADELFNRFINKNPDERSELRQEIDDIITSLLRLVQMVLDIVYKSEALGKAVRNRQITEAYYNAFRNKEGVFESSAATRKVLELRGVKPGTVDFIELTNGGMAYLNKRLNLDSPKLITTVKQDRYKALLDRAAEIIKEEQAIQIAKESTPQYFEDEMQSQYESFVEFFKSFRGAKTREIITSSDVEGIKKHLADRVSASDIDNMLSGGLSLYGEMTENEVLDSFRKTLSKDRPDIYYGERKAVGTSTLRAAIERLENGLAAQSKDYKIISEELSSIDAESKGYRAELGKQAAEGTFTYGKKNLRSVGVIMPRKTVISKKQIEKQKATAFKTGVKKGFNIGAKTGMNYMRGIAEDKALSLQEKKDRIVKHAETALPESRRGRMLKMITRAKTEKDVMKAIGRIDRVAEQARSQAIIAEIKKVVSRVMKTESIDIGYKERISALIDGFNLTNKRRDTIDRLSATKQYIARLKSEGKQVDVPARVQKAIEDLDKTLISSMNEADLMNLLSEVAYLEEIGKNKLKTRRAIYEMKRDRMKEEVIENTVRMEMNPVLEALPGDKPLTIQEKLKNLVPKTINFFSKVDKYISPVDVIFDILDGSQGFVGANYRLFKRNLDVKFGLFLDRKDVHQTPVKEYVNKHKMTVQQFERIGVHAARVQEGGMEKLANLGLTEDYINGIELTEVEMDLYNLMRKNLDDLRPEIERIMRTVYNKPLAKVDNYFSFMTDFEKVSDVEILERIVNAQEVGQGKTKTVKKGFTLKRTGPGGQKIKVNAMDIYLKHTENASYLVEMAESIQMLSEIANSQEYLEASGEFGAQLVREWLDTMARKGGLLGEQQIEWLDKMRVNLGAAVLGFKLTAALIQPTALFNGAAIIGNYAFIGAKNITDQNWRTFLKQFPELRDRMADDPSYLESGFKSLEKLQRAGYTPLQKLDSITASAIVAGAYQKYMEENGKEISLDGKPDPDGVNYAETVLRRTQSSAFFKDVPLVLTRGKVGGRSITKALLQFQNFLLNAWSLLRHEGVRRGIGQKKFTDASRIFIWTGVSILVATGIREGIKQALAALTGDDDEDKKTFAEKYLKESLGYIPFVSQGMSVYSYGSFPVPALSIIGDIKIAGGQIEGKREDTRMRGWIRAGAIFGKLFGIPGTVQTQAILNDLTYK